jgi:hypothetical protein
MKINVMAQIKSVKDENETREAEPTKEKTEAEVEAVEPVEDNPVAMPTTRRKSVDYNRGDMFLPDTPEPETPSPPKAASTDRREERKPATNADKSDADRLLDVWEDKHPYEMRHREQVIDMASMRDCSSRYPDVKRSGKQLNPP